MGNLAAPEPFGALIIRIHKPRRWHMEPSWHCDDAATPISWCSRAHEPTATHQIFRSAHGHWRDILFWWLLVRYHAHAGCRRRAFHPTRICQARARIPCAIPRDIATMSNLFQLPRRRHLAQTHSYGVWTSSITVITGKLISPGKVFGRLRIETARCACSSRA